MIYMDDGTSHSNIQYFDKCIDSNILVALLKIKHYNMHIGNIKNKANKKLRDFVENSLVLIQHNSSIPDSAYNTYYKTALLSYLRICMTEDEYYNIIMKYLKVMNREQFVLTKHDEHEIIKVRGYNNREEYKVAFKNVFCIGSRIMTYDSIYDSTYQEYPDEEMLLKTGLNYTKTRSIDSYYGSRSSNLVKNNFLSNIEMSNTSTEMVISSLEDKTFQKYILKVADVLENRVIELTKEYIEFKEYLSTLEFK